MNLGGGGFPKPCYVSAGMSMSQNSVSPLSSRGCGPCSPEMVSDTN